MLSLPRPALSHRSAKAGRAPRLAMTGAVSVAVAVMLMACSPGTPGTEGKASGASGAVPSIGAAQTAAPAPAAAASGSAASGAGVASGTAAASPAGGGGQGPVSVTTVTAEKRELAPQLEANGAIAPRRTVDVRAQMSGVVREVLVREGDSVKAGQALLKLDDRAERTALDRTKAQLLKDEATLEDARRQLLRSQELQRQNFVSQGSVDAAATAVQAQAATVAASKAAVQAAEVSLSYTVIQAPLGGRLGVVAVQPGSFIAAGNTPLMTISELNPVHVVFSIPQRYLQQALRAHAQRESAVTVLPGDNSPAGTAPASAPVVFVDNVVDGNSGTVRVKAELSNTQAQWWPGLYVKVRFALGAAGASTVVPVAAVVQNARGQSVFTVDEEGKAQVVKVEMLDVVDGMAALKGLPAGAKVVVEGRQNLRPGTKVVDRSQAGGKQK